MRQTRAVDVVGKRRSQAVVSRSDDKCDSTCQRDDFTFGELTIRRVGVSASRPAIPLYRDVMPDVAGTAADYASSHRPRSPRPTSPDQQSRDVDSGDQRARSQVPVTVSLLAAAGQPDSGLGFDVTGDQSGAVFVREVFERGPATQTGKIRPGTLYTSR